MLHSGAYNPAKFRDTAMDRRTFLSQSSQFLALAQLAPKLIAETSMPDHNQRRNLSFSNDWIESSLGTAAQGLHVDEAIVVNLSTAPTRFSAGNNWGTIAPWKSTILRDCTLESGERVAFLHVMQRTNLGGLALKWEWYGQKNPGFSQT